MSHKDIWTDRKTDPTLYRLQMMASSLTDRDMVAVLTAAAVAWEAGDRSPLVIAVVAFADGLIAELPPTLRLFATGSDAANRLAIEAERYEGAVRAIGGSVDEYRRLLAAGLTGGVAYGRMLHEANHQAASAVCRCIEDQVNISNGPVVVHVPGRVKPDSACPLHGRGGGDRA